MPPQRLLRVSRPRFWIYTFGPYIVGALAGASHPGDFLHPFILLFGLFFLYPANVLIYGVNDIFDYETDKHNPKKEAYEALVKPAEHRALWTHIAIVCLPFAALLPFVPSRAILAMAAFLFFSLGYSIPPIRAKARPIVDSIFNVLYILPGVFSFTLMSPTAFSPALMAAGWLWTMAMHAYSAVPDITADRTSGMPTVATRFGYKATILLCLGLYLTSAIIAAPALTWLASVLGGVYAALMFVSLKAGGEQELLKVYRWFPTVNTLSGMGIFFYIMFGKGWI